MKKKLIAVVFALAICAGMVFAQASSTNTTKCSKCGQTIIIGQGHRCPKDTTPRSPRTPSRPSRPNTKR